MATQTARFSLGVESKTRGNESRLKYRMLRLASGPVFCLLLRVNSDCAWPITGQVTSVTWPVIGWAQSELTLSKRQKTGSEWVPFSLSTSRLRQNGCCNFADIFRCILLKENVRILLPISLKFFSEMYNKRNKNKPALVQTMAWCWKDDKPFSEPVMAWVIHSYVRHLASMSYMTFFSFWILCLMFFIS